LFKIEQERRAAARKPHDPKAILFHLKFASNEAVLQRSKHIGTLCSSSMRCLVQPQCMGFHVTILPK